MARYQLRIDGNEIESEGLTCMIANSSNLGRTDVNLVPNSSVSDGLLDVVVVHAANLSALFDVLGSITGLKEMPVEGNIISELDIQIQQNLRHWQGKEIALSADRPI